MNFKVARRIGAAAAITTACALGLLGGGSPAHALQWDGFGYKCNAIQVGHTMYASCHADFSGVTSTVS